MITQPENQEAECQQASDALVAYFDDAATEAELQLATAHLKHCLDCAQMWQEWQSLRLMEQRALEPVALGEMLPLTPVKVPRHLKAAILRKTVATPIWERFWPRILTGMAVPTLALGCWLLIVAAPWQQSLQITDAPQEPQTVTLAQKSQVSTPVNATNKNSSKAVVNPTGAAKSVTAPTVNNNLSHPVTQSESRPVSTATRTRSTAKMATVNTNVRSTRSIFKMASRPNNSRSESIIVRRPQISMASFERPYSRAVNHTTVKTARLIEVVAPKPRATAPVLLATLPTQDMTSSTDASSDPMYNYVAKTDVRPDDIRQAVENYRAALLDGSDL